MKNNKNNKENKDNFDIVIEIPETISAFPTEFIVSRFAGWIVNFNAVLEYTKEFTLETADLVMLGCVIVDFQKEFIEMYSQPISSVVEGQNATENPFEEMAEQADNAMAFFVNDFADFVDDNNPQSKSKFLETCQTLIEDCITNAVNAIAFLKIVDVDEEDDELAV